jgi:DNA-binding response OmpR family regulator
VILLLERIAALLRRESQSQRQTPIEERFGDVLIDLAARRVTKAGQPCALTPKAYELLLALLRRDGAVAGRNELLKEVWGYGAFVMTRTVDSHIAELRRKLETDPSEPRHIVTVWKVGYRLAR